MQRLSTLALVLLLATAGLRADDGRAAPEESRYEVVQSVEYTGDDGAYRHRAKGVVVVAKAPREDGSVGYALASETQVAEGTGEGRFDVTTLPLTLQRDPTTERFVGGDLALMTPGALANATLAQGVRALPLDGRSRQQRFVFDTAGDLPREIVCWMVGRAVVRPGGGRATVLTVEVPLVVSAPDLAQPVEGSYRAVAVLDAERRLLFHGSAFELRRPRGGGRQDVLRIESAACRLEGGAPVRLADLSEDLDGLLPWADCATDLRRPSTVGLPRWACHGLTVRGHVAVVADVAMEGATNPLFTVSVLSFLAADTGVSVATGYLKKKGVITWAWPGTANLVGQGYGLMAAKGYESVVGEQVDETRWANHAGIAGDLIALALPAGVLAKSARVAFGGALATGFADLATRVPRIARYVDLALTTGRGVLAAGTVRRYVDTLQGLIDVTGKLNTLNAVVGATSEQVEAAARAAGELYVAKVEQAEAEAQLPVVVDPVPPLAEEPPPSTAEEPAPPVAPAAEPTVPEPAPAVAVEPVPATPSLLDAPAVTAPVPVPAPEPAETPQADLTLAVETTSRSPDETHLRVTLRNTSGSVLRGLHPEVSAQRSPSGSGTGFGARAPGSFDLAPGEARTFPCMGTGDIGAIVIRVRQGTSVAAERVVPVDHTPAADPVPPGGGPTRFPARYEGATHVTIVTTLSTGQSGTATFEIPATAILRSDGTTSWTNSDYVVQGHSILPVLDAQGDIVGWRLELVTSETSGQVHEGRHEGGRLLLDTSAFENLPPHMKVEFGRNRATDAEICVEHTIRIVSPAADSSPGIRIVTTSVSTLKRVE